MYPEYVAILEMLRWDAPDSVKQRGLELARKVEDIWIFLQPQENLGKAVWGECARILCEKSDGDLEPYFVPLLQWLQDLNWPGAWDVLGRLRVVEPHRIIRQYACCISTAEGLKDESWLYYLSGLIRNRALYDLLGPWQKELMLAQYGEFWGDDPWPV